MKEKYTFEKKSRFVNRKLQTTVVLFFTMLFIANNALAQNRLYWIGPDNGSFTTAANWTTHDNGTPSGNTQTPNQYYTVVFNNYSFSAPNQRVVISAAATCDSMIWEATGLAPILDLQSSQFSIYGSLQFQPDMEVRSTGTTGLFFYSDRSNETIITCRVSLHTIILVTARTMCSRYPRLC